MTKTETETNLEEEQALANEDTEEKPLTEDKKPGEEKPAEPSVEDRIASLEKENKGLQGWATAEKKRSQTVSDESTSLRGQLEGIQGVLAESMARREDEAKATTGKTEDAEALSDLGIEVNEDGGAFLPRKALSQAINAEVKKALKESGLDSSKANVEELTNQLHFNQEEQARDQAFKEHREMLLSDDANEPYSANFPKLDRAQTWFKNQIIKYQEDNRITRKFSYGEAIDIAMKEGISKAFAKKYSTLNFEKVVRMYESDYDFGEALKSLPEGNTNKGKASIADLKKLSDKASNLSGVTSQKEVGGDLTLDAIAGMSVAEMEKLSPEDTEKIEKILEGGTA